MKIIFLDIDGVLCNAESFKRGSCFKAVGWHTCIESLNTIIAATGAKIVISSTWRMRGLEFMRTTLEKWNVQGEVIGLTPRLSGIMVKRGHEIEAWLSQNGPVDQFVILDDDCDMCHLKDMLVWTKFERGLTMDDAKRAIEILSGAQYERAV